MLSPSTEVRDRRTKTALYLDKGVTEVWLVDPVANKVQIRGAGGAEEFAGDRAARSRAVPGFTLVPAELFRP